MLFPAFKQPLYDQLVEILSEKIDTELSANDKLPSERELSKRYGLSRTTVRLALDEMERLGLVYRLHGKGTFVADRSEHVTNLTKSYSFTESMIESGRHPETIMLEFSSLEANKVLAQNLHMRIGERVIKIKRLRKADGISMMVERTYLPYRLFSKLQSQEVAETPLYELMEAHYLQKILAAEEQFSASIAKAGDAHLLEIEPGSPVLDLVRTTYNQNNEVVEYTLSVARADQFKYKVTHIRS